MVLFMGRMFIQGPDPWEWQSKEKGKGGDLEAGGGHRRKERPVLLRRTCSSVWRLGFPAFQPASPVCSVSITGKHKYGGGSSMSPEGPSGGCL